MSLVPFDDRDGWIWLDGQFVPWREATVHVLTHGLHYASAVFEGERMYGGEIFELTAHTERLFKSAEILDFEIPFTVAQIDQACKDTCAKNGLTDAYVRPIAWRGYVAEATGANVFFVKDGGLLTPTPDCFLDGITRRSVMELARTKGFEVIERHIKPEELADCTECFIVGTAAEVTPVSRIGDYQFRPGNISLSLMDDYARMVRRELVGA